MCHKHILFLFSIKYENQPSQASRTHKFLVLIVYR